MVIFFQKAKNNNSGFELYNLKSTIREIDQIIVKYNYKRIIVQFPDGLLGYVCKTIINHLRELKVEIILAGDPSFGACDLPTHQAELFKVEAIFHFGHSSFAFSLSSWQEITGITIHYFPVEANVEIRWDLISKKILSLNWNSIGIITTIQHTSILNQAQSYFNILNINVSIHKEGQILGCNQNRAVYLAGKVDGFLVIAGGNFHASPVVVATNRPTLRYDPFNLEFKLFDDNYKNSYLKQRYAMILKARKAKNWGVLLSIKSGQFPSDQGKKIIKLLEKAGKNAVTVPMYKIDPNHLINFEHIEAWVINLCPRIATDDYVSFRKPIITSRELLVALDIMSWEHFINPKIRLDSSEHLLMLET